MSPEGSPLSLKADAQREVEWYSVRMRAAEGGPHENGGRHISGAEKLVQKDTLETHLLGLLQRAMSHSRGEADFIHLTVEKLHAASILRVPPIAPSTVDVSDFAEGREQASRILRQAGVSDRAVQNGLAILKGTGNLHGAVILHGETGERLDGRGLRGVRVTRMDWDARAYSRWVQLHPHLASGRIAEAVALASKVCSSPYTVAEWCWSDDPDYVTGYVASAEIGYRRITHLKRLGDPSGGRIFYVRDGVDVDQYIAYLENTPVWVGD